MNSVLLLKCCNLPSPIRQTQAPELLVCEVNEHRLQHSTLPGYIAGVNAIRTGGDYTGA